MNPIVVILPIFVLVTAMSFFDGRVPDEWVFWTAVALTIGFIIITGIPLQIWRVWQESQQTGNTAEPTASNKEEEIAEAIAFLQHRMSEEQNEQGRLM